MSKNQQQMLDAGAIGIDLGSSRSVIACAKKRGIDIVVNQASQRETSNIVSYGANERYMGEQAEPMIKSNFRNTVSGFNRLLGLTNEFPPALLNQEKRWISSRVVYNDANKLVHQVSYKNQDREFLPEQVTASFLKKLKSIIHNNNLSDKEAVISVPNYYTEQEKKALIDACKIAELTPTRLVSEAHAIATSYGIFRKSEFKDAKEPRHVVFVDIGHSKFSAFLASFTKEKATILAQSNDRYCGCRDMDWILLNFYDKIFDKESNGLSILENKKAIIRTLDVIQKQRKTLSANQESSLSVEAVVEDYDINYTMKREEFELLIQPVLKKIEENCLTLFSEIMSKQIQIHSIEIIGGGTRIPAVQNIIQQVFKKDSVGRTLNASECIARGCATQAAVLSPQFHVLPYTIEDYNLYPIKVEWKFIPTGEGMEIETKQAELFKKGCVIPNIKSLTFKHKEQIQVRLYYDPVPEGFKQEIAQFNIPATNPSESDFGIKLRIKLNESGIIVLTDCNLIEDYTVEEKVEIKKDTSKNTSNNNAQQQPNANTEKQEKQAADQQQQPSDPNTANQAGEQQQTEQQKMQEEPQYEIKQKHKTRTTQIHPEASHYYHLAKKLMEEFFTLEAEMNNHDFAVQEKQQRKNELESYIYNMRHHIINGPYKDFTDPQQLPIIAKALDDEQAWLYGEGAESHKSEYIKRTENLKILCESSHERFRDEENFSYSLEYFFKIISESQQWASTTDPKYSHIGQDLRQQLIKQSQDSQAWIQNAIQANKNSPKYVNAPFTSQQLEEKINSLKQFFKQIQNTPIPTKKEEAPVQEQKIVDEKVEEEQVNNTAEETNQQMDLEQ